ncbi:MAG TPA: hypothetical protein VGQ15_06940 [Gaiellaceae bacterium]|jgi:hypothetical protein|nr:hypothetical protein [Gaiellaceae bacterium]
MPEHRFCDEFGGGFGWILEEMMGRTSHALAAGGAVWLVDPVDVPGLDERIAALGEPRGVLQLIDRHGRDCAALAARLGVPHHRAPFAGVPDAPFEVVRIVSLPAWREDVLWWPAERTLVAADALGTLPYFREPGARIGVHPLLRLVPPLRLGRFEPFRVLCGHGEGIDGESVADELRSALARSRRALPAALLHGWRWARNRD